MAINKSLLAGSTSLLLLRLLQEEDLYGYQMIERLRAQSNDTFTLKAGTLYPLLHALELDGFVQSYEQIAGSTRFRKYYHITEAGRTRLAAQIDEWNTFTGAVNRVLKGGARYAAT